MKRLISVLFLISLGFGQQIIPQITETYENGNIKSITYHKKIRDSIVKVKLEHYWENGRKSGEGTYKDGKMNGLSIQWYENGQISYKGTYENGLLVSYSFLNKDGSIKEPIHFENLNERVDGKYIDNYFGEPYFGEAFSLHENGQRNEVVTFKDGKLHGLLTKWYENGQKEGEISYKDGKKNGLYTMWYENRQKKVESTYKDGEVISEKYWYEDGSPK